MARTLTNLEVEFIARALRAAAYELRTIGHVRMTDLAQNHGLGATLTETNSWVNYTKDFGDACLAALALLGYDPLEGGAGVDKELAQKVAELASQRGDDDVVRELAEWAESHDFNSQRRLEESARYTTLQALQQAKTKVDIERQFDHDRRRQS